MGQILWFPPLCNRNKIEVSTTIPLRSLFVLSLLQMCLRKIGAWDKIDLSGADLNGNQKVCEMQTLTEAYLSGADLEGANLTETKFCETKMPNGTIDNSGC